MKPNCNKLPTFGAKWQVTSFWSNPNLGSPWRWGNPTLRDPLGIEASQHLNSSLILRQPNTWIPLWPWGNPTLGGSSPPWGNPPWVPPSFGVTQGVPGWVLHSHHTRFLLRHGNVPLASLPKPKFDEAGLLWEHGPSESPSARRAASGELPLRLKRSAPPVAHGAFVSILFAVVFLAWNCIVACTTVQCRSTSCCAFVFVGFVSFNLDPNLQAVGFCIKILPLLCERKYGASRSSRNGEEDDHPGRSFGTTLLLRDTTTTTGSFHSLRGDRAKSRRWCRNFERDRQQNRQALSIGNQRCRDGESHGFQEGKRKAGKPFSSSIAQFLRKKQLGFEKLSWIGDHRKRCPDPAWLFGGT